MKLKLMQHDVTDPARLRKPIPSLDVVDAETGEQVVDVVEIVIDRKPDGKARVTIVLEDTDVEGDGRAAEERIRARAAT